MGKISPQFAQSMAAACITDIGVHDSGYNITNEFQTNASIGYGGARPNFHRTQLFKEVLAFPTLVATSVMTPFKDFGSLSGFTLEMQDIFLPHEEFASLFQLLSTVLGYIHCAGPECNP